MGVLKTLIQKYAMVILKYMMIWGEEVTVIEAGSFQKGENKQWWFGKGTGA